MKQLGIMVLGSLGLIAIHSTAQDSPTLPSPLPSISAHDEATIEERPISNTQLHEAAKAFAEGYKLLGDDAELKVTRRHHTELISERSL